MLQYLKITLFVTVALIASAIWPAVGTQAFAGNMYDRADVHHTFSCAGHNETERQLINDSTQPEEAARINRRYHERLAALFSYIPFTGYSASRPAPAVNGNIIYGIAYNSKCLSTCYQYIFRLSPF